MRATTFLIALALVSAVAAPAAAQSVDVRVKGDTQAIREVTAEIREALREALGPDMRRDIQREITSASRSAALRRFAASSSFSRSVPRMW